MKQITFNCMKLQVTALAAIWAATLAAGAAVAPAITTLPPLAAGLDAPCRVAADTNGNAYVVDNAAGKVALVDVFNRIVWQKSGFHSPLGIALDADGNIYLAEAETGTVTVYNSQWAPQFQLGSGPGEFGMPSHIAIDSGVTPTAVYVSDSAANEIKVYQAGLRTGSMGGPSSAGAHLDYPAGVWVSAAGEVYVSDQNNERVSVFNRAGVLLRGFNLGPWDAPGSMGRAAGITGDAAGRIYVADTFQGYVKVFDEQGTLLGVIGGYGDAPGLTRSPAGLALDGRGRLLAASPNTGRVEAYGLDCFNQLAASPAQQSAPVGGTVTFSALVGCPDSTTFQWRKGTNDLVDGGIISGATNALLSLQGVTLNDAGAYSVAVAGPQGAMVSPAAQLSVIAAPVITSSPASRSVGRGATTLLTASATGSELFWRWYCNGLQLPVPNTNSILFTNIQFWAAGNYTAIVTNSAGSAATVQASLAVVVAPYILTNPVTQTVAERGTATFSVQAGGGAPLRYQWYFKQVLMPGQTNTTLVLSNVTPANTGSYYAQVSNPAGVTNSLAANLTVIPDTVAPVALIANGGTSTGRTILVSFSEALNVASAQQPPKYQLLGPGGLSVISAVVTGGSKVLLTLSGFRSASADYLLKIQNVTDNASAPNMVTPNPTTLSVLVDGYGTVGWWPLDEGTGTFTRDASGNGFDGTLESATWVAGRSGQAVNLSGTAGDVVIPALNLNTNAVTISAWLRRSGAQTSFAGVVFTRAGSSVAGINMGATNELRYHWNDTAASYNYSSGLVLPDNVWTFAAVVIEPTRAVFYMNSGGGMLSAVNTTTHAIEEFNGITYLGWDSSASARRFRGAIDGVRICNRALSAAEIQALYAATALPVSCVISSPAIGSVVATANPTIVASVINNGNAVNKVEFFGGTNFLGAARTAPYTLTWSNLTSGSYSVQARAWYGPVSYSATSPTVNFTVAVPIISTLSLQGGNLLLQWTGGLPPYQVQAATNLVAPVWENAGPESGATSMIVTPGSDAAFYRVIGH